MRAILLVYLLSFVQIKSFCKSINFEGGLDYKGTIRQLAGKFDYTNISEKQSIRIEGIIKKLTFEDDDVGIDLEATIDNYEESLEIAQGHINKLFISSKEKSFESVSIMIQMTNSFLSIVVDLVGKDFHFAFISPTPSEEMISLMYYSPSNAVSNTSAMKSTTSSPKSALFNN